MVNFVLEDYVKKQLLVAICLNFGHIICGYSVGWSGTVIHKLQDPSETPLPNLISVTEASWVGSMLMIGNMIGPYISGPLSNVIGRKWCMIIAGFLNILAQAMFIFSRSLSVVLAGRTINGMVTGIITVVNVVYIGEIASPNIRGIILTSTGAFHALGSLLVYSVGPYVSYASVSYVLLGVTALYMLGTLTIPESPTFYVLKGNKDAAKLTLSKLGRNKHVEDEVKTLEEKAKEGEAQKFYWKELFTFKSNRKSFAISFLLVFFQQWSGVTVALFFAVTIFEKSGSSIDPAISTIILGVTQLIGAIFVPFLIERTGRKIFMLVSTSGCCINMAILSVYFYLDKIHHPSLPYLGWLPLVTLVLSVLSYSVGLNIIPNTITGELFRPNVRSIGSSISMTLGYFTGFICLTSFGYLIEAAGIHWTFAIFAIVDAIAFIFTLFFVPETKGMTLVEIENMLGK